MPIPAEPIYCRVPRFVAVLSSALLLAGCVGEPAPIPTPIAPPATTAADAPPAPGDAAQPAITGLTWPLTGMPAEDAAAISRPSVAVKVDNATAARPQVGIDQADVVVEEIVEGGTTRFLAIYQSALPTEVAPVRSGRTVDTKILPAFGTDLAMSGAADPTLQVLRGAGLNLWLHGEVDGAFWRVKGRKAPHNLAVNIAKVHERVAAQGRTAVQSPFLFDPNPPSPDTTPGTKQITSADIKFSDQTAATWTWQGDHWTRTQQGHQPWKAATVVFVQASVGPDGGRDSGGHPTVDTNLTGSGTAVILRNGIAIEGTWRKNSDPSPLSVVDQAGAPVFFAPGQIWIELAPNPPTLHSAA